MNLHYTDKMPVDVNGNTIKPLDLVVLGEIPSHYWSDDENQSLRKYCGSYGLVTYHPTLCDENLFSPYYLDNPAHPGWVDGAGETVYVISHRDHEDDRAIASTELWMPAKSLTRIPHNLLIMNLFVEYPWEMNDVVGPSSHRHIRQGLPEYDYLKRIIETPYERLVAAHDAAMAVLDGD